MTIKQQPVLSDTRLTVAMAAMMGYCNDTDCTQCPFAVKQNGQTLCNFSAQHMHAAFATIKSTGIATPLDGAQRDRARKNDVKKTVVVNIRVEPADKQRMAEISALTGISASQLFREFMRHTYDSVRRRSASELDKWRGKYYSGAASDDKTESVAEAPKVDNSTD